MEATKVHCSKTVKKLQTHLRSLVGKAICDYNMIEDGDRARMGTDAMAVRALMLFFSQPTSEADGA